MFLAFTPLRSQTLYEAYLAAGQGSEEGATTLRVLPAPDMLRPRHP